MDNGKQKVLASSYHHYFSPYRLSCHQIFLNTVGFGLKCFLSLLLFLPLPVALFPPEFLCCISTLLLLGLGNVPADIPEYKGWHQNILLLLVPHIDSLSVLVEALKDCFCKCNCVQFVYNYYYTVTVYYNLYMIFGLVCHTDTSDGVTVRLLSYSFLFSFFFFNSDSYGNHVTRHSVL